MSNNEMSRTKCRFVESPENTKFQISRNNLTPQLEPPLLMMMMTAARTTLLRGEWSPKKLKEDDDGRGVKELAAG